VYSGAIGQKGRKRLQNYHKNVHNMHISILDFEVLKFGLRRAPEKQQKNIAIIKRKPYKEIAPDQHAAGNA